MCSPETQHANFKEKASRSPKVGCSKIRILPQIIIDRMVAKITHYVMWSEL